jgi:hypothetical protein
MNATQPPDPDPNSKQPQPPPQTVVPARELITEHQIGALLSVMHCLKSYLILTPEEDALSPNSVQRRAHSSAAATFSQTCKTLDGILTQKKRWNTATHDMIYENVDKIQKAHLDLLKSQRDATKSTERPSRCWAPEIRIIDGGGFIAFYGDITQPGRAIIGQGRTPAEAMASFDQAFYLSADDQIVATLTPPNPVDKTPDAGDSPDVES